MYKDMSNKNKIINDFYTDTVEKFYASSEIN